jgi:hypothetical protein
MPVTKSLSETETIYKSALIAKFVAALRMAEELTIKSNVIKALAVYLNAKPWGTAYINVFYQNLGKLVIQICF